MQKGNGYKDLTAWQKSMDLVVCVYELTEKFPKNEQYNLTSQIGAVLSRYRQTLPREAEEKQRKTPIIS